MLQRSVRVRAGFSVQLPHSSGMHRELSPMGCSQHQQDLAQHGGSRGTCPRGQLLPCAPGWQGHQQQCQQQHIPSIPLQGQLSSSGVNSSLPAMSGGCRKKPSGITVPTPCLFWIAVAKVQSLCCLCSLHFPIMLRSPSTEKSHAKMGGCLPSL